MSQSRSVYRDVTHDPEAESKAVHAPELREALVNLGFRRVGILEARIPNFDPRQVKSQLAGPDAHIVTNAATEGEVNEILASPDRRAFAIVARYFGGPLISMQTVMEDGTIVETTMKPQRGPDANFSSASMKKRGVSTYVMSRLIGIGAGEPPRWPRQNSPQSGYHLELVETDDAETLWQRHQRNVQAISQTTDSGIRPHTALPLYLAINQRSHRIRGHKAREEQRISSAIATFNALIILGLLGAVFFTFDELYLYFAALVVASAIFALSLIARGYIGAHLIPRLPGPPLQPVDELLREVPKIMTTEPLGTARESRQ